MRLHINMRIMQQCGNISESHQNAEQFATWLLEVGEGIRNDGTKVDLLPRISSHLIHM